MKKKTKLKKRIKLSPFERILYVFAVLVFVLSPVSIVFSQATLSKLNFQVEKEKNAIDQQKKFNESLNV